MKMGYSDRSDVLHTWAKRCLCTPCWVWLPYVFILVKTHKIGLLPSLCLPSGTRRTPWELCHFNGAALSQLTMSEGIFPVSRRQTS